MQRLKTGILFLIPIATGICSIICLLTGKENIHSILVEYLVIPIGVGVVALYAFYSEFLFFKLKVRKDFIYLLNKKNYLRSFVQHSVLFLINGTIIFVRHFLPLRIWKTSLLLLLCQSFFLTVVLFLTSASIIRYTNVYTN